MATTELDDGLSESLAGMENFFGFLGFCHYDFLSSTLSWITFFGLGLVIPLLSTCFGCKNFMIDAFELEILVFRSVIAAVSLLCISRNLRKYGFLEMLCLDGSDKTTPFHQLYARKIRDFYIQVTKWFGICLVLKSAQEILNLMYRNHDSRGLTLVLFFASLSSWSYTTMVFLSGCCLFHLIGNLQTIHLENSQKFLEKDLNVCVCMSQLCDVSKVRDRFRMFLFLEILIVTASQFVTMLTITEKSRVLNLSNVADFAVMCIVELVGIVVCLNSAAKMSLNLSVLDGIHCLVVTIMMLHMISNLLILISILT